jgi:hypothetical protein
MGLATWALAAGVARAQQQTPAADKEHAAKLAADAETAGKKQQFADALSKYKEAAKLDPGNAAYQCNIGMAYYALGDEARAHIYFGRCFKANGGWPANVEDVFNYVVGVLGKEDFTPLEISGTPASAEVLINLYAEEGPLATPVTVYVPYSNYQIQVRAVGHETKTIPVEAKNRSLKKVTYELTPSSGASSGDPGPETSGPAGAGGNLVGSGGDVEQQVDTGGGRRMWPLAVAGGGVVAGVGGFLFRRAAKDKQADLCQLTTMPGNCDFPLQAGKETQAEDLKSAMRTREILSWSFYGVGVAAVGAGLFLYFTQSEDSGSSVAVSAAPASDGGMVFFSFTH